MSAYDPWFRPLDATEGKIDLELTHPGDTGLVKRKERRAFDHHRGWVLNDDLTSSR